MSEPLRNLKDVAEEFFGKRPSPQVIYRWCMIGIGGVRCPARMFGNRRMIRASEFEAWLDEVSVGSRKRAVEKAAKGRETASRNRREREAVAS